MSDDPRTRVTLFVPGPPASRAMWNDGLHGLGLHLGGGTLQGTGVRSKVAVEGIGNDGKFGAAFSFGNVADDVVARIAKAPGALVLHWPVDLREGRTEILGVVKRLRSAGALAVRVEQSKLGWDIARWIELMSSHAHGDWYRAAVTSVEDHEVLQTCGMHAFSLPDVRIPCDDAFETLRMIVTELNVYQLVEDPILLTGQTFRPDDETPRRVIERWPDTLYVEGDICNNPYGVWRLGPAGGQARAQSRLALAFTPALRVLLTALESRQGRALSQREVEKVRDGAQCIAIEQRDMQKLERSRGYADLEPELLWEQWQLARPAG